MAHVIRPKADSTFFFWSKISGRRRKDNWAGRDFFLGQSLSLSFSLDDEEGETRNISTFRDRFGTAPTTLNANLVLLLIYEIKQQGSQEQQNPFFDALFFGVGGGVSGKFFGRGPMFTWIMQKPSSSERTRLAAAAAAATAAAATAAAATAAAAKKSRPV